METTVATQAADMHTLYGCRATDKFLSNVARYQLLLIFDWTTTAANTFLEKRELVTSRDLNYFSYLIVYTLLYFKCKFVSLLY